MNELALKESGGEFLLYQTEDGRVRLDVRLEDELNPEVMRVVFKDTGFADDVIKINAVQILCQAGIDDVKSL